MKREISGRNAVLTGEVGIIAMVFELAMRDLRTRVECTCAEVDTVFCERCKNALPPNGADERTCGGAHDRGGKGLHLVRCWHLYRTARRFLLGTRPEWRAYRDELCELVGREPLNLEAAAVKAMASASDRARRRWNERRPRKTAVA